MKFEHQLNVYRSLDAAGSVSELSDPYPRVVKSQSMLYHCSGHQLHHRAPVSAGDKSGNANDKPVITWDCLQVVWEHQPHI